MNANTLVAGRDKNPHMLTASKYAWFCEPIYLNATSIDVVSTNTSVISKLRYLWVGDGSNFNPDIALMRIIVGYVVRNNGTLVQT